MAWQDHVKETYRESSRIHNLPVGKLSLFLLMAANQGHHVGSLPNDYAILAMFSHEHNGRDDHSDDTSGVNDDSDSEEARLIHTRSRNPRRSSFPSTYIRPQTSTIPSMNFKSDGQVAGEETPLLTEFVPRIEEAQFGNEDTTKSHTTIFWEEFRILVKYTLPVFG